MDSDIEARVAAVLRKREAEMDERIRRIVEERFAAEEEFPRGSRAITDYWMDKTTSHGINRAFFKDKTLFVRVLWIVIFIAALGVCGWLVGGLIQDYLKYEPNTKVDITWKPYVPFPAVTICNVNPASKTQMEADGYSGFDEYIDDIVPDIEFEDMVRKYGQKSEDLLIDCVYGTRGCSADNFTSFFSPAFGQCHTFNNGELFPQRNSISPGYDYGLQLILDVQQWDYLPSTEAAGVVIDIHSKDKQPTPHMTGIYVPPGVLGRISMRQQTIQNLKKPYTDCQDIELSATGKRYSVAQCMENCKDTFILQRCNCVPAFSSVAAPANSTCSIRNYDQTDCIDSVHDDLVQQTIKCECPRPCYDEVFATRYSQLTYPSDAAADLVLKEYNVTRQEWASNWLRVEIYFDELNIEQIWQQDPNSPQILIGNIGGNLGLFLGMSWISLFEFIEYAFWLARDRYRRRHNNKVAGEPHGETIQFETVGEAHV